MKQSTKFLRHHTTTYHFHSRSYYPFCAQTLFLHNFLLLIRKLSQCINFQNGNVFQTMYILKTVDLKKYMYMKFVTFYRPEFLSQHGQSSCMSSSDRPYRWMIHVEIRSIFAYWRRFEIKHNEAYDLGPLEKGPPTSF